jgi:hypothetical protein
MSCVMHSSWCHVHKDIWAGLDTATGAYGNCCKPAHTVHVVKAPAGDAAAAAPDRGALAGPSAPTSTSTRWALVTP